MANTEYEVGEGDGSLEVCVMITNIGGGLESALIVNLLIQSETGAG